MAVVPPAAGPILDHDELVVPFLSAMPGTAGLAAWSGAALGMIDQVHPASGSFRPVARFRIGFTRQCLHLRWEVEDRYVLSRTQAINGDVYGDSCVEAFLQPLPGRGYLNLEINAGGTVHCGHIRDPRRVPGGFADRVLIDPGLIGELITVRTTLSGPIQDELTEPCTWAVEADVDFRLFAAALGGPVQASGSWRANFYHCSESSSHPRWLSWRPIGEVLCFHQPSRFGRITFAPGLSA